MRVERAAVIGLARKRRCGARGRGRTCRDGRSRDPDYGNPYNDIGAYLIELGRPEEAIPWLEKAIAAKRYCCYQFPHFNLGRVLFAQGNLVAARQAFEQALRHDPSYVPARMAVEYLDSTIGKPLQRVLPPRARAGRRAPPRRSRSPSDRASHGDDRRRGAEDAGR